MTRLFTAIVLLRRRPRPPLKLAANFRPAGEHPFCVAAGRRSGAASGPPPGVSGRLPLGTPFQPASVRSVGRDTRL